MRKNDKTTNMIEAYPLTWPVGWPRTSYPKSSRFDCRFAVARDSIMNERTASILAELETKYESEKKESKIALLTKDKEISAIMLKKSQVMNVAFGVGGSLMLILFV